MTMSDLVIPEDPERLRRLVRDYAEEGQAVKTILAEVGIEESTPERAAIVARDRIAEAAAAVALAKVFACSAVASELCDPGRCDDDRGCDRIRAALAAYRAAMAKGGGK